MRPIMHPVTLISSSLLVLASALPAAELPVKQVVLSSAGVGYVEHAGTVEGSTTVQLSFKVGQINDVLKSLVLMDQDGGKIGAVVYPSQEPLERTLKSFQVDLTGNPSLAQLLQQLKGAPVKLKAQGSEVRGTIVGTELRSIDLGDKRVIQTPVLTVVSGGVFRQVRLDEIGDLTLEDERLHGELTKALAAVATSRDQDKKPVTLRFEGQGKRRVQVGYVSEMPLWKVSYRLLLPENGKTEGTLQAWAIVENQTDSDWNDISLALVSGRPIAFVQDLYRPLYLPRPVVEEERFASLSPQTYGGGMGEKLEALAAMPPGAAGFAASAPAVAPQRARGLAKSAMAMESAEMESDKRFAVGDLAMDAAAMSAPSLDPTAGVRSMADSERLGVTFRYRVPSVSLPRQQSAMLPILTETLAAEPVSIYRESVLARHPLQGALVTNTTKAHLLNGPVTVLDPAGYAGDARLDLLPPGEHRLLSFAVDTPVTVDPKLQSSQGQVVAATLANGILTLTSALEAVRAYTVQNSDSQARTLVVEHPRRDEWEITGERKPFESTPEVHRFRTTVEAGKTTTLTVEERSQQHSSVVITDCDEPQLLAYSKEGKISKRVQDALRRAADLKRSQAEAERAVAQKEQDLTNLTNDQERLRQNLRSVQANSDYAQRLLKKLNDQESKVETLESDRDRLRATAEEKRQALADYLNGLRVE